MENRRGSKEEMIRGLSIIPASDLNYQSLLRRAKDKEIEEAIDYMIDSGGKHKGRIKACKSELKKRGISYE